MPGRRASRARPAVERPAVPGLLGDLQQWNDDWDHKKNPDRLALEERGRDLAIRVQDELGTDGWEVLYQLGGLC